MGRSYTLCDEPPTCHMPSEIKHAAYLVNKQRRMGEDILEVEIPRCYLTKEALATFKTPVQPDDIIVMCINRRSQGVSYLIERETPNLSPEEMKTHAKELDEAMAKEWGSWNDHQSFEPRLRSKASNVIDARWVHKWKMIDGTEDQVTTLRPRL